MICKICAHSSFTQYPIKGYIYHECTSCQFMQCDIEINSIEHYNNPKYWYEYDSCWYGLDRVAAHFLAVHRAYDNRYHDIYNVKDINILDFGCGQNQFSFLANSIGMKVTGADILAKPLYPANYIDLTDHTSIIEFNNYDLIISVEVFEHLQDPYTDLLNLRDFIKPGGWISFQTGLNDGTESFRDRYCLPQNGHISIFSKKSLDILGERLGFKLCKDQYIWMS